MSRHSSLTCLIILLSVGCRDSSGQRSSAAKPSTSTNEQSAEAQKETQTARTNSQPQTAAKWTPPPSPNLDAILDEARQDVIAGRYEEALAKYEWFFRTGSDSDRGHNDVRLSSALHNWKQLSDVYPPAKAKLIEIRDEAEKKVANDDDAIESFSNFAAINSALGEEQRTVALFKRLDKEDVQVAGETFEAARPALIKAGELQLCSTYVDPKDYLRLVEKYHEMMNLPAGQKAAENRTELAQKSFSNSVTTLVALLVLSDRNADAERIAADAKSVWADKSFAEALDKALKGELPAASPS
jgi:hypothetical protein